MQLNNFSNYHPYRLNTKQRRFIKRWERRRQMPRWQYLLYFGVLREGLIFFSVIKVIQFLYDHHSFMDLYSSLGGIVFLLFEVLFWFGGGLVIGWFKYSSYETEYEMLKSMEHY